MKLKSRPKVAEKIIDRLKAAHSICVTGHIRPDGDCIGSMLGLGMALAEAGKEVSLWNEDPVPTKLRFLDVDGLIRPPSQRRPFDLVVALDCAAFERLGVVTDFIQDRGLLINIDHHESNTRYGDINWISPQEPATGELIFRLLKMAKWRISPAIADCLFTAISTDTGSFQYPSTRPSTYQAAGELVHRGANLAEICDEVYQSYPLSRVKLLRLVYNRFRLIENNQIAYFWLKREDYARTGAGPEDSEGLIDHVRAIEPVIIACVFEELEPEVTRISLRSKAIDVNVSDIAREFKGGGHPAASGARIEGRPLAVQRRVLRALRNALKNRS